MEVSNCEIIAAEKALLPEGCVFSDDARKVIQCWESKEILACPGSGKTTLLLAKLKILSAKIPLENGQGICVLSHTNVAVDEIKTKLSKESATIMGYPNYVGTIHGFLNRYIVLPYLRTLTSVPLNFVNDLVFADSVKYQATKAEYSKFHYFILNQCGNYPQYHNSIVPFIADLEIRDDGLFLKGTSRKLAGITTPSVQQYQQLVQDLLKVNGIIRYQDTYNYLSTALSTTGSSLKCLLPLRFKYVFIDEYQDCSIAQREALDILFSGTESVVQKIGDVDQAIYNNITASEPMWIVKPGFMPLCYANRYGQEIADVLTHLRTNREFITARNGNRCILPVLILYDKQISSVIDVFVNEIESNGLVRADGIYKAVGMFEGVSGLKISDYWCAYRHNQKTSGDIEYREYVLKICKELENGNLCLAESYLRKIICKVYRYYGKLNLENGETEPCHFTPHTIKQELAAIENVSYRSTVLQIVSLPSYGYELIEPIVRKLLAELVDDPTLDRLPASFTSKRDTKPEEEQSFSNIYTRDSKVFIQFSNVWGVKGETHDATLYLETERSNSSDLRRIMGLLECGKMKSDVDIAEKSRKCVFVGFSRPRHMLCVAMRKSTFAGHSKAFDKWKVISLE